MMINAGELSHLCSKAWLDSSGDESGMGIVAGELISARMLLEEENSSFSRMVAHNPFQDL